MIFKDLASMVHDQGEIIGKHYSMSLVYIHNLISKLVIFNQDKLFQRPTDPWESLFLDNGMDVPIIIRVITGCLSRDLEILIIPNWTNYLDSIETNIENAVVDIQQGNTQLRQARDHQVKYPPPPRDRLATDYDIDRHRNNNDFRDLRVKRNSWLPEYVLYSS